ncbi:MAG: YihY family inner membrane protein [Chitinispirillaceae bacterium]|nr:YihY family inner membrane protein [Chitinispirillaceae bacterium]
MESKYLFSRSYFRDIWHNPGDALMNLRRQKSRFWYGATRFFIFWRVVLSEYSLNNSITRSSALAYALLLAIIPLVTTAAFMIAGFIEVKPEQVREFFALLLPFAPETVLEYITLFFINAQKLRGVGIVVLIVVAIGLFGSVEESYNTIWKVTRSRSPFVRLRTFTMVMVYSPILFLLSFQVRRSAWFDLVSGYFVPIDAVPFLFTVLAFTSLIVFIPNTRVRFGAAVTGGLVSGLLFEAERRMFGRFVVMSIQTQTIYGAVGMLPLFLISLFLAALIILFGAQVAYVVQNFRPLLRAKRRWDRRVGDYKTYVTFRMMLDCVEAFIRKRHPPALRYFCTKYELTDAQSIGILNWLIHEGFLHTVGDRKAGYVPTRDFSSTPVIEVINAIESQSRRVPKMPDDLGREFVQTMLGTISEHCSMMMKELTFATLIERLERQGSARRKTEGPSPEAKHNGKDQ